VGGVPREGNGLTGMRERVTAIGGTLQVAAGRHGVLLTVTV
jgi:signal transduction histidine kinase